MVKKQLFISVLFSLGFFFSSIEAAFPATEKLKTLSRKQLKKIETEIFEKRLHINQAQPSQLLDALIKKENSEQFEKSVNQFHIRNLIDDRQKSRFLKRNQLRKENDAVVTSIDNIRNKLKTSSLEKKDIDNLKAANDQLIQDIALEERSDEKNKDKYAALKAYTNYMSKACTALFVANTVNSYSGQPESDNLNVMTALVGGLYLLGKVASYFLLENQPKAALVKDFTSSLESLDKVANILPENGKLLVTVTKYGATAYPYLAPIIEPIYNEMQTWPLEEAMV